MSEDEPKKITVDQFADIVKAKVDQYVTMVKDYQKNEPDTYPVTNWEGDWWMWFDDFEWEQQGDVSVIKSGVRRVF